MKVVHVSYSVGRSSANTRLHFALLDKGIESKILTLEKNCELEEVYQVKNNKLLWVIERKWRWLFQIIFDKVLIKNGMPYHMGIWGKHVEKDPLIQAADVVHLHWVCDFVSSKTIEKLILMGKPVIWTCHDYWPMTGGCNCNCNCRKFQEECSDCILMKHKYGNSIIRYVWGNKKKYLKNCGIRLIAPSNWMAGNVSKSKLFEKNKCYVLPNAIDLINYCEMDRKDCEAILNYYKDSSKIHILFGATSINIPYKGFRYLIEMLNLMQRYYKETASKIVLHILGEGISYDEVLNKYECQFWGYISDERKKACIYNLADYLIYPSLEDNLPNMVMESLACATPVISFKTGGIPDMVEHQRNGYIAEYKDSMDLLKGLIWCIGHNEENNLGRRGREKICGMCSADHIAEGHIKIYKECIEEMRKQLCK